MEAGTLKTGLPVEPSPTGAAPGAARIIAASSAEHDIGVAVGYDLSDFAFEVRLSLRDAKRPYFGGGCWCQACPIEFVLLMWEVARGEVHPFEEVHRDDIGDEFGHLAEVSQAVLYASRAEGDIGWVAPHQVEV